MVLRSQEREQEVTAAVVDKPAAKLIEDKWCDDEDDWGNLSKLETIVKLPCCINILLYSLSFKDKESLSSDTRSAEKESSINVPPIHVETGQAEQLSTSSFIPSHYIQVIEEPDGHKLVPHSDEELAGRVYSAMGHGDTSSELYEKTLTKHGDKTFYKFHKRISRCPEQVLRSVDYFFVG